MDYNFYYPSSDSESCLKMCHECYDPILDHNIVAVEGEVVSVVAAVALHAMKALLLKQLVSTFVHACEGDAVTKLTNEKILYFNAPIHLQNKTQIGKVDEIFGPINEPYFSIKMVEGIVATSYSAGDKLFIDPTKLLPHSRFLPQPKGQAQAARRGGGGRDGRGGGGGFRGRGASRGGGRGGGFRGRGRS